MSEKLYGVDQFYPGDFAPILTGVYTGIQFIGGQSRSCEYTMTDAFPGIMALIPPHPR